MMRSRRIVALAGLLGSMLIAAIAVMPAMARTDSVFLSLRPGLPSFSEAASPSATFAGLAFYAPTQPGSVSVEYKEPAFTCTSVTQGVTAHAQVFTGSGGAVEYSAGTGMLCLAGKPRYIPALVVANSETDLTNAVAAGDLIKVSVMVTTTKATVTFSDLTAPRKFTKTISGAGGSPIAGELIGDGLAYAGGTAQPIVNFHSIAFSSGVVDGEALGAVTPRTTYNMVSSSTKFLQIATSALTGALKNAFTTTWKHS